MADVKISALPAATTPLAGTEVLPIVQSSTTKKVAISDVTAGRAISASSLTLTTPLSVANGGTGLTSLTAGYIPYGNGTSAFNNSANLTYSGTVLTAVGEIYASQAATNTQQIRLSPQSSGSNIIYSTYAGTNSYLPLVFNVGGSDRLTINTSGNLGLGVTPSAWVAGAKSFEIGTVGFGFSSGYGNGLNFGANAYYDGAFKYGVTSAASRYAQAGGVHAWYNAPSGTAGAAITFTTAMTLDASGILLIGGTSAYVANTKLEVTSAGSVPEIVARNTVGAERIHLISRSAVGTSYVQSQNSLLQVGTYDNYAMGFTTNNTERMRIDSSGNVVINTAAIATNATDGFLYVPTCAGTPTGTPTTYTGRAPIVVNTTNNKLYFYSGGAWRDAGP